MIDRATLTPADPPADDEKLVELERWGIEWKPGDIHACKQMPDGYWTPWHIAADRIEELNRLRAADKAKLDAAEEVADALVAMIRGADDRIERAQTALEDWRKVNG